MFKLYLIKIVIFGANIKKKIVGKIVKIVGNIKKKLKSLLIH